MKINLKYCSLLLITVIVISGCRYKREGVIITKQVISLQKYWEFSIGKDERWTGKNYDDSKWEKIKVPSSWEDQGFNGYDGFACYRIHFKYDSDMKNHNLYLNLGRVDDADRTYINGHLIGFMGTFPPHYQTAYYENRRYYIPPEVLDQYGDNVIVVQVFDGELSGGILDGNPSIEIEDPDASPDFNLAGIWDFKTGDDPLYSEVNYNYTDWEQITVPAKWETQGYADYDGFAWYRRKFTLPENLKNKDIVLLMGKIDDIDQTFINGHLVGSTGNFSTDPPEFNAHNEYLQLRGYSLPAKYLNQDGNNYIAVRVYDGFKDGGIYEGPIGLISPEKFTSFWRKFTGDVKVERKDSFWNW